MADWRREPGHGTDWRTEAACGCWTCIAEIKSKQPFPRNLSFPFIVCDLCGNKRCPRATHHDHACTGSNDTDQPGSRY